MENPQFPSNQEAREIIRSSGVSIDPSETRTVEEIAYQILDTGNPRKPDESNTLPMSVDQSALSTDSTYGL